MKCVPLHTLRGFDSAWLEHKLSGWWVSQGSLLGRDRWLSQRGMTAPPSDVKLALQKTSSTLLQQIEALEKRTSELKRSRAALEHKDEEKEEKENKERKRNSDAEADGKSEDEDRSKLPQVVGDESKTAILSDPRGWARERLAASLREKGKDLEQRTDRHGEEPKTFDAPPIPPGDSDAMGNAKPSAPGTMAKATGMMKAPNPMMAQGAVAKGASLAPPLAPLAPLSMPLAMPPFQAKGAMPCGLNGGVLPKALGPGPKMPGMPGMDLPCGAGLPGLGSMGCGGCGACGGSMGSGVGKGDGKGEGGDVQDQVMLQMQMQMQMMMMGAMMGSMLGEGEDEKKGKKKKKNKKEQDDDLPPGPSSDSSHPSYRPPDMEHMPGITDRRFEGRITMWFEAGRMSFRFFNSVRSNLNQDKGYGFIGNEELKQRFNGMDVQKTNTLISKVGGKNLAEAEGRQRATLSRITGVAKRLRRKDNQQLLDISNGLGEYIDVAETLGLSADPAVQEIGDEQLLKLRKSGTLDPRDDAVIAAFKRHKATIGRALFEAENANNLGVEMYLLGDYATAAAYFEQALKLSSEKKKSAAAELEVLKAFINEKYGGNEDMLYTELVMGEWRSALGHNKFVESLARLDYPGDPHRVFEMLDSVANDGKVSLPELTSTLKAKRVRLNKMDMEPSQKGVVLSNLGCCSLQKGDVMSALQSFREAARILRRTAAASADSDLTVTTNMAVAYVRLGDCDAALQYLSVALEKREGMLGHLHEDVLNALYLTGYCFLVKANRFDIVNDRQRMDQKKQENPLKVNYHFALCSFKILSNMPDVESVSCDVGARRQLELHIARSHEIIAEIHDKCEDLDRAREHLMAALRYKHEILDAADPDLFSTLNVYAGVCSRSGKNKEALEAMNLAMAAAEELFGAKSGAVATQLFHTSLIYLRTARAARSGSKDPKELLDQAATQLQQCLSIRSEVNGPESEEVASTAQLLGEQWKRNRHLPKPLAG
eukprot:Skav204652  [mRNA]  locus=scaffold949:93319:98221:- [translate_table: standard]